ncbi:MAG TPA: 4'-phosphopantetheinyl transferase superfamily protein [Solirubrobacterales bacterium]|nr:4'-phosphopantetheinyl transferase superfamily protein [Solirubrobacterales bacterium]
MAATRSEIEAPLFRGEALALRSAVESRRREFITGRACAREALGGLGLPATAVLVDAFGAPRWPVGVVGSITHCTGYRAAAVGRATDFAAIGIDAEPNLRLPAGVLGAIALPVERERVGRLLHEAPGPCWDRLLFSAKEAVFKAWYPMTGAKPDFHHAEVTFELESGRFRVRLRGPHRSPRGNPSRLVGRWAVAAGILATAIALSRPCRGTS